jgi:GNAT superfamily N-acetyltransferase
VIRLAKKEDVPRIVELGSLSLKGGPYEQLIADHPEHTAKLAINIIAGGGKILLWDEDGQVSGLLAFIVIPHPFSGELTADEAIWYVLPEARKGGAGIKLLWAAEQMAKEMGAKKFQFASPMQSHAGAIYERFGYREIEVSYLKNLEGAA